MSKHLSTPFRFDYVGSFLRPARLKEARQKFSEQAISADELKAVEDDCIRELVAKQKAAGYHVITDGEFRRSWWHFDFLKKLDGVEGFEAQTVRVFENLKAVAEAAGGSLADAVKLNIYLTDLANFAKVNEVMARYFAEPYPARAAVGVKELPRGAVVEADAVLVIG